MHTAEKDATGLLDEVYESIGQGDTDGLMTLAAEPLVVYGPRKGDAHATRSDALVALKASVDPKKKRAVRSSGSRTVVASPGGHSAWAFDVVDVGGEPFAVTAVLSNADDVWQLSAAQLARTPAMKAVRDEVKRDAVVPPGMAGVAKIDPAAKLAVDKLVKGLTDPSVWADDLERGADAVLVGPGSGEVERGAAGLKKLFKKRMKANVRETAAGETTAAATSDGQLAWVTLPVVRFEDDVDPLPLRVFAVFEKRDAQWKLTALQEAIAVDAPGAGAAFKRVAPPAPPKVEAPPPVAPAAAPAAAPAGDDAAPPKKKKKHKHKKKPVDADT